MTIAIIVPSNLNSDAKKANWLKKQLRGGAQVTALVAAIATYNKVFKPIINIANLCDLDLDLFDQVLDADTDNVLLPQSEKQALLEKELENEPCFAEDASALVIPVRFDKRHQQRQVIWFERALDKYLADDIAIAITTFTRHGSMDFYALCKVELSLYHKVCLLDENNTLLDLGQVRELLAQHSEQLHIRQQLFIQENGETPRSMFGIRESEQLSESTKLRIYRTANHVQEQTCQGMTDKVVVNFRKPSLAERLRASLNTSAREMRQTLEAAKVLLLSESKLQEVGMQLQAKSRPQSAAEPLVPIYAARDESLPPDKKQTIREVLTKLLGIIQSIKFDYTIGKLWGGEQRVAIIDGWMQRLAAFQQNYEQSGSAVCEQAIRDLKGEIATSMSTVTVDHKANGALSFLGIFQPSSHFVRVVKRNMAAVDTAVAALDASQEQQQDPNCLPRWFCC